MYRVELLCWRRRKNVTLFWMLWRELRRSWAFKLSHITFMRKIPTFRLKPFRTISPRPCLVSRQPRKPTNRLTLLPKSNIARSMTTTDLWSSTSKRRSTTKRRRNSRKWTKVRVKAVVNSQCKYMRKTKLSKGRLARVDQRRICIRL